MNADMQPDDRLCKTMEEFSTRISKTVSQLCKTMEEFSTRISKTVSQLREWQALEYSGYFIDVEGEPRQRINQAAERTDILLEEWGMSLKPKHEHEKASQKNTST